MPHDRTTRVGFSRQTLSGSGRFGRVLLLGKAWWLPDGIQVAEASNGFQLVEHGLWNSAQAAPAPSSSVAKDGRVDLPDRYDPKACPAGFRRASYLPHVYAAEAKYSLPAGLLDALVWTESLYNPVNRRSIGTPYRRAKGTPLRCVDRLMLGAGFALLAA